MLVWTIKTSRGWQSAAFSEKGLAALTLPVLTKAESIISLAALGIKNYSIAESLTGTSFFNLEEQLHNYFNGIQEKLDFAIDWSVFTPFQQKILKIVKDIPYGTVLSYGQVAGLAGYSRASRAVGGALGANKILLVIPCHRVIYGNGTLGGFGSDLRWKERLLALEGLVPDDGGKYPLPKL